MQQRRLKDQDEDEEEKEKKTKKKGSELRIHDLEEDLEMSSDESELSDPDSEALALLPLPWMEPPLIRGVLPSMLCVTSILFSTLGIAAHFLPRMPCVTCPALVPPFFQHVVLHWSPSQPSLGQALSSPACPVVPHPSQHALCSVLIFPSMLGIGPQSFPCSGSSSPYFPACSVSGAPV